MAPTYPRDGEPPRQAQQPVLVWDLPTRIFHWLFALSFFTALVTGDSDRLRDLHVFCGYFIIGLVCFRVIWGLAGSRYARFKSFLFGPSATVRYLKELLEGRAARHIGHNPPGSWAIFALLILALAIGLSGMVVLGAEESQGIFKGIAGHPVGELVKELHESLSWLMFGLVLLHLAGVIAESRAHRENLVKAMLTGRKPGAAGDAIAFSHRLAAVVLVICMAAGTAWYFRGRLAASAGVPYLPFIGGKLPDNKAWRDECGSCHTAYHATLLPARSWKAVMDRQNDHFGEILGLDAATVAGILEFLRKNAAETGMTEAAYKINRSIPAGETPLRITETGYWIEKHRGIDDKTWKHPRVRSRANCNACHLDADQGTYEDAAMRLPK